LERFIS